MNITQQLDDIDGRIDEIVGTEEYDSIVSRLKSLYAKHLKKQCILAVENGELDDRYPSNYADENFIFESGYFELEDSKAQEIKDNIVQFYANCTDDIYPYIFTDEEFLNSHDQCCQIYGSGGRGNCQNGHQFAKVFFFENIKLAYSQNDFGYNDIYVENEKLIESKQIHLEIFHKYNQKFNDHFDELTLIDFVFGFYKHIYIGEHRRDRTYFTNAEEFNKYIEDEEESNDSD